MTNYFVGPGGDNGNPGTNNSPWVTIQYGIDYLKLNGNPGDILILKSSNTSPYTGRYKEKVTIDGLDGTAGNYYTIHPQSGGSVLVSGATLSGHWHGIFYITDSNYIHISGLEICNAGADYGIIMNGSDGLTQYNIIDYCEIHDSQGSGFHCYGSNGNVRHLEFAHNTVYNVNNGLCGESTWSPNEAISISNTLWPNIHHNNLSDYGKEGIDLKSGTKSGQIHHNIIDTTRLSPKFQWDYDHIGIYVDGYSVGTGTKKVYVSSNYIIGYGTNSSIMIGAEHPETGGYIQDIFLYNNVIDSTYVTGYKSDRGLAIAYTNSTSPFIIGVRICNNTFYTESSSYPRLYPSIIALSDVVIANNIFAGNGYYRFHCQNITSTEYIANPSKLLFTNNLFYRFGSSTFKFQWQDGVDKTWGTNEILTDPRFVDRTSNDLHLLSTSDAISGGTLTYSPILDYDNVIRGTHVDIGAYEYTIAMGNQPPVAVFNWTPVSPIEGQTITFDASDSYDNDGYIIAYEWDWDDDGIYDDSTEDTNIQYIFTEPGDYNVTLRVTDNEGETDTQTNIVTIGYTPPAPSEGWYSSDWGYRKTLVLQYEYISGNHTNFPFCCKIVGDSDLISHALPNGTDIIFVDSSNTVRLKHEIDTYSNGTGIFWVKIPTLWDNSYITDYTLFMYYGNPTGGDQTALAGYKPSSVWDDSYAFVCHMNDSADNQTLKDSSKWNNTTKKYTAGSPSMIKSPIGSSQLFTDVDASFISSMKINAYHATAQLSMSAWISGAIILDDYGYIMWRGTGTSTIKPIAMYLQNATTPAYGEVQATYFTISTNRTRYPNSLWNYYGNMTYLTLYYHSSVAHGYFMDIADVMKNTNAVGNLASSNGNWGLVIGNRPDRTRAFSGSIDEVRYSTKYRTKGWQITEYNNIMQWDDFFSISDEETESTPALVTMTIAGNMCIRITGIGYMKIETI